MRKKLATSARFCRRATHSSRRQRKDPAGFSTQNKVSVETAASTTAAKKLVRRLPSCGHVLACSLCNLADPRDVQPNGRQAGLLGSCWYTWPRAGSNEGTGTYKLQHSFLHWKVQQVLRGIPVQLVGQDPAAGEFCASSQRTRRNAPTSPAKLGPFRSELRALEFCHHEALASARVCSGPHTAAILSKGGRSKASSGVADKEASHSSKSQNPSTKAGLTPGFAAARPARHRRRGSRAGSSEAPGLWPDC